MNDVPSFGKPIRTGSIVRKVLMQIEEALLNKELKPGDCLPSESELVRNLGVGKSSIREAVKMLEALGVVEVRQGGGTFIRKSPSAENINPLVFALLLEQSDSSDIIELRAMFEPAYTLLAMNNATQEDREKIGETIKRFEERIKKGEQDEEDDLAFHRAILESTHNPFVIRIGSTILELFRASIRNSVSRIPETALADHKRIFECFCGGNGDKLQKAIHKSFEGWMQNGGRLI